MAINTPLNVITLSKRIIKPVAINKYNDELVKER
jgi:hypothetical protein